MTKNIENSLSKIDIMDSKLNMITSHLRNSKFGLSISDLAKKTGLNRNTISRYLTILATLGQVEIRPVGPSHVYHLSERLPISPQFLALQPQPTLIIDKDCVILALNTCMQEYLKNEEGIDTDSFVGKNYLEFNTKLFRTIVALPEYINALNGKMPKKAEWAYLDTGIANYRLLIFPIIFYNGMPGIMIQGEKLPYFNNME